MGTEIIDLVQQYKYLGILLDQHFKYHICDEIFAKSDGRALTSLISKYNIYKKNSFDVYTNLFNSCIKPVIMYAVKRAAITIL